MPGRRPLRGWKEIAQYLGTSERTAQRWERELGLPVHRVRNTPGATVYASANELDIWRTSPRGQEAGSTSADEDNRTAPFNGVREPAPADQLESTSAQRQPARHALRRRWLTIVAAVAVLVAAGVVVAEVVRHAPTNAESPRKNGRAATSGAAEFTIVILKVTDASGQAFTCRVMNGGEIRILERHKAAVTLTPMVEGNAERLQVSAAVADQPATEHRPGVSRTELRRATAAGVSVNDERIQLEWIGTETTVAPPTSGDPPSDVCGIECGPWMVQALQVETPCGNCCGLKFAGCRR